MSEDLGELHDELRAVARDLLSHTGTGAGTGSDHDGPTPAEWTLMARSGWLGLEVPEALDGSGATFAEVGVILEEMGRAATRAPYLGGVVLGVGALGLVDPCARREDLMRRVAAGEVEVAVALCDGALDLADPAPPFRLEGSSRGLRLDGQADFVPDAPGAATLLVVAADPAGVPVVVVLPADAAGLTVTEQPVLDQTRRMGAVVIEGALVDDAAVLPFAVDAVSANARLHDRAALAVAHDSLGVARAMLDATVEYVGQRRQFDRPIGSFQAVKHACADMLVDVTVVEELVRAATRAFCAEEPGAAVAVSRAKARSSDAAVRVAGTAMQLHGGIGYTWESGIHVHLKRAALDRSLFGSPSAHRRRVAAHLGTAVVPRD